MIKITPTTVGVIFVFARVIFCLGFLYTVVIWVNNLGREVAV